MIKTARAGPTCGASYTRRRNAGTCPQTASPPSPCGHTPGHARFPPPGRGPHAQARVRADQSKRRLRTCRACGAHLRPPPNNPYSRPPSPPPLLRRAAPTGRTGPTTKTLSTGTADGPPHHMERPRRARCSRRSSCRRCVRVRPRRGPPPRLAGAPVCYRGGGVRCAPPRFAAARPHWALPRTNQPHLAGKAQGDDPRVGCMCGRDALSLTAAAGGRGVAARAGHKTDAGCRCVARTDSHVPTSLLQARVWPAVTRLSTDPRRLATAALHPPCHDRVVSIWLAAVRSHPPPPPQAAEPTSAVAGARHTLRRDSGPDGRAPLDCGSGGDGRRARGGWSRGAAQGCAAAVGGRARWSPACWDPPLPCRVWRGGGRGPLEGPPPPHHPHPRPHAPPAAASDSERAVTSRFGTAGGATRGVPRPCTPPRHSSRAHSPRRQNTLVRLKERARLGLLVGPTGTHTGNRTPPVCGHRGA